MLQKMLKFKKRLTAALDVVLIIAVALLVIDVVWGVFTRFLLVWVSLLGGAVAFGTKGHLGVDFFVSKFDPQARKIMAVFVHLVVLFFAGAIFLYGGGRVVADALAMEQTTPALGWKMGYVYLALPISGFFMILFTLENLIETLLTPASQLHEAEAAEEVE